MAKRRKNAFFASINEPRRDEPEETIEKEMSSANEFPTPLLPESTGKPRPSKKKRLLEKTTTYFSQTQRDKLEDLAHRYKKQKGKRISWHDVLRYLVDTCSTEQILHADIKASSEGR